MGGGPDRDQTRFPVLSRYICEGEEELGPPPQVVVNEPSRRITTSVVGVHTRRSQWPDSGPIVQTLDYLASLEAMFGDPAEAAEAEADIAGATTSGGSSGLRGREGPGLGASRSRPNCCAKACEHPRGCSTSWCSILGPFYKVVKTATRERMSRRFCRQRFQVSSSSADQWSRHTLASISRPFL